MESNYVRIRHNQLFSDQTALHETEHLLASRHFFFLFRVILFFSVIYYYLVALKNFSTIVWLSNESAAEMMFNNDVLECVHF